MEKYFAVTRWMIDDIKAIKPEWTEKQCEQWWIDHGKAFSDLLTQYGNECLQDMLDQ